MAARFKLASKANDRIERQLTSPIVSLILLVVTFGALTYLAYILRPDYRGDLLPYALVIIAEVYIIIQQLLSFWTILNGRFNPRSFGYYHAQANLFGVSTGKTVIRLLNDNYRAVASRVPMYLHKKPITVDVFIPVYGEPVDEIRETAVAARDAYGLHATHILDDGKSDEVKVLAEVLGINYIRRPENKNAKAGNINYALSQTSGDFFLILDADFVAKPTILYETIPFFDNDNLAFVQTPQVYGNTTNFVAMAANHMQDIFYSLIQSGKNRFNAAFCVGTNVIFRRSAIEQIGGIYDKSKSEDIWTSLMLHERGYESIYIPSVLAIGKTPETLKAYSKQQLRWATGSFEILLRHNPLFARKLTIDQRIQYFLSTTYYLVGFATLLLLLLPPLQIYFNLSPISVNIPIWQWAMLYSGFYVTQLLMSVYIMGGFKLKTLVLATASFTIYIKAFFNALTGRDQAWQATNSVSSYDSPFNYVRMQVYVFTFLVLTSIVGVSKAVYTNEFSVSLVWNMLSTAMFGYFVAVAYSEARMLRRERKRQVASQAIELGSQAV